MCVILRQERLPCTCNQVRGNTQTQADSMSSSAMTREQRLLRLGEESLNVMHSGSYTDMVNKYLQYVNIFLQ